MHQLKAIVFILTVTLINSAPLSDNGNDNYEDRDSNNVTLLKFINEPLTANSLQYQYEYVTSDGQTRQETGILVKNADGVEYLSVRGSYSYFGPDDVLYSIFYTADENGFQTQTMPDKVYETPVPQLDQNAIKSLIG